MAECSRTSSADREVRPDRRIILAGALAVLAHLGMVCNKKDAPAVGADRPNVVLITFDTTRADYLSCYGRPGRTTPTLDRLAGEGIRYTNCYTAAPITLPSHATMLTGLYPFQHGLRDNGAGPLDEKAVTLAEVLKAAGYHTGAVVGAYVLHSRYGLKQGFDFYDDEFSDGSGVAPQGLEFAERNAQAVSDAALAWLNGVGDGPYFLWAHYFDPHAPYAAPGAPKDADLFASYSAEITYADAQLDRLLRRVDALSGSSGRKTLIVFAGDHGEALGEHGESSHALFAYDPTLRAPLIVKPVSTEARGVVVSTPVSLADISPSILYWLGLSQPYELPGQVLPTSDGSPPPYKGGARGGPSAPAIYFETYFAYHMYGWSPLEGVVVGNLKYIAAPMPEMYDLAADPKEARNLSATNREPTAQLASALAQVKNAGKGIPTFASGGMAPDAESLRKLRALGYVGTFADPPNDPSKLPDPKAMLEVRLQELFAEKEIAEGRPEQGVQLLGSVVERDPNNRQALKVLGEQASRGKASRAAVELLGKRMEKPLPPPLDATLPAAMGDASVRMKEFAGAAEYYSSSLSVEETNAEVHVKLGMVLRQLGRAGDATAHFRRALELAPNLTEARKELGSLLSEQGRPGDAVAEYETAAKEKPDDASVHYNLGVAYMQVNRTDDAVEQFRKATGLDEQNGDAWVNLGIGLLRQGSTQQGREALLRATQIASSAGAAYYNLGVAAAKEGNIAETAGLYEKAMAGQPPYPAAIEELASYYIREKRFADALRVLRIGAAATPDNLKIVNTLAGLLATCHDDALRNGQEALTLAKHAAELTQHRQPAVLATLAAAYAETGDFASAVSAAQKALGLLDPGDRNEPFTAIQVQLDAYQSGRPYRNPRY